MLSKNDMNDLTSQESSIFSGKVTTSNFINRKIERFISHFSYFISFKISLICSNRTSQFVNSELFYPINTEKIIEKFILGFILGLLFC